jgi:hypothetical protein
MLNIIIHFYDRIDATGHGFRKGRIQKKDPAIHTRSALQLNPLVTRSEN